MKAQSLGSCWLRRKFVYDKQNTVLMNLSDIYYWDDIHTCEMKKKSLSAVGNLDLSPPCTSSRTADPHISKKHILSAARLHQEIIHLYNYKLTKGSLYSIWLQVKDAEGISMCSPSCGFRVLGLFFVPNHFFYLLSPPFFAYILL